MITVMGALHCELWLTLARQTRPVSAHVTPDSRLRSAFPPALLAQLVFPMGAACWKSCLQMFQLISLRDPLGHTSTQFVLCSGRKVVAKVNSAKLYLDSHLSESDWCGLVIQFGPVYAQNFVKKLQSE